MNGRTIGFGLIACLAVAALASLGTYRWASAYGPDVTLDGRVRVDDMVQVIQAYGQNNIPTPPIPVREQNLDGSGNIKVHEQGTVSVNVANASLPVTGTVNVGNLPVDGAGNVKAALQVGGGRFTSLLDDIPIAPGGSVVSPFANVDGCRAFEVFIRDVGNAAGNPEMGVGLELSADGVEAYGAVPRTYRSLVTEGDHFNGLFQFTFFPGEGASEAPDPFAPFARVRVTSTSGGQHTIDVSLYCVA